MKIKFNRFERLAGLFVMVVIVGTVAGAVFVAVKKGFFERKYDLYTYFESANGINPGSQVQMSGLRIGSVDEIILESDSRVMVHFTVPERYFSKIKQDSIVRTIRPFIIGDKVLDISVGSEAAAPVKPKQIVQSETSSDIMDLLGGRTLGPYLNEMSGFLTSLRVVLQAFAQEGRADQMVKIFDQLGPTLENVNTMARGMTTVSNQITKKKNLERAVENLVVATDSINLMMPQLSTALEQSPNLAKDMVSMMENLSRLTAELTKVIPALAEVAPDLPHASRRAVEAMNEAVIVLKAMQKSFLLRGSVEEVREEEAKSKEKSDRMPADSQEND